MKKIIFLSLIASSIVYADVVGIKQYIVDAGNYKINYEGKERVSYRNKSRIWFSFNF